MTDQAIRIVLADDHPAFREGVRSRLAQEPGLSVVGEASDGHTALAVVRQNVPDVLLLDMEMPGLSGLEVTEQLHKTHPQIHILILSAYEDEDYIFGVLELGASGYLTKHEPLNTIIEAIRGVANGETRWLSGRIALMFSEHHVKKQSPTEVLLAGLSDREAEVLLCLAKGRSNQEIGQKLFISESTVKKHVNSLFEKIGLGTRAQVVAWAWKNGIVKDY
ncbi:MAG: response regulator transcription factor [Rhodothermia bacterium]|nr:response regulator transcription factor [Rhodothermia bacterium]